MERDGGHGLDGLDTDMERDGDMDWMDWEVTGWIEFVYFVNLQTVPTECEVMYDWFHIYPVHGVANMEIGLLVYKMSVQAQFRGGAPWDVFSSRNGDGPLKCFGSETLNARTALRVYILLSVWDTAGLDLKKSCVSFLKLCSVLDRWQSIARGVTVRHLELEQCIVQHLKSFKDAHGTTSCIPKCHMALHLGPMWKHHNMLLSCWTHERKHNLCQSFWQFQELGTVFVAGCFAARIEAFEHACKYACVPRLSGRTKASVKEMKQNVQELLGTTEAVYSAVAPVHSNLSIRPNRLQNENWRNKHLHAWGMRHHLALLASFIILALQHAETRHDKNETWWFFVMKLLSTYFRTAALSKLNKWDGIYGTYLYTYTGCNFTYPIVTKPLAL